MLDPAPHPGLNDETKAVVDDAIDADVDDGVVVVEDDQCCNVVYDVVVVAAVVVVVEIMHHYPRNWLANPLLANKINFKKM